MKNFVKFLASFVLGLTALWFSFTTGALYVLMAISMRNAEVVNFLKWFINFFGLNALDNCGDPVGALLSIALGVCFLAVILFILAGGWLARMLSVEKKDIKK